MSVRVTVSTAGQSKNHYRKLLTERVARAEVDCSDGASAFVYVGEHHVQFIYTLNGKEIFREVWQR